MPISKIKSSAIDPNAITGSAIADGTVTSADLDTNIAITGDLTVDTDTLYVDSTNNRIGVGTSSPTRNLVISDSSQANIALQTSASGSTLTDGFQIQADNSDAYVWNYENTNILFGTNNTERLRILSSGGITFNGDTATDNALDDYEEGTWTPTLEASSSNPTVTYSSDTGGYYIKVGRAVHYTGTLRWTACSGGSGSAMVGGLPYSVASRSLGDNADGAGACRTILWNGTSTYVPTIVHMKHGTANLNLMSAGYDRNTVTPQASDLGSTGYVAFTITIYTT